MRLLVRGRGALARTGLQRSPRRTVRPGRSAPPGGTAAAGHRDQDGRRADARPARGRDRRAGDADERQPHAGAVVVPADAGALPLWPPGGGAAGVPGPAGHPGRRVGNRAGARRGLAGARRPRPGPGPGLPSPPARDRHRACHDGFGDGLVTRLPGPGAGVPARGTPGRPGQRVGAPARLVDVGRPGRRSPPPGRRRPGHREDAAGVPPGARRRGERRAGAVGPLRRGSRRSVPAFRRGARALFPVPLGGPHFAYARLAAQ